MVSGGCCRTEAELGWNGLRHDVDGRRLNTSRTSTRRSGSGFRVFFDHFQHGSMANLAGTAQQHQIHRVATKNRIQKINHPFRPSVCLQSAGGRFRVSGATVWNDLPFHVASAPSLAVFRQRLTTFLFSRSYQDAII